MALAKRTLEKVTEAFEEFLKPKVIQLYSEVGMDYYRISRLLGISVDIYEKWIKEEVIRMHDKENMTFRHIGRVMNRSATKISEIYCTTHVYAYSPKTLEILEDN